MNFPNSSSAHISPCGSILVALLNYGRVLIVEKLHRVVNGEICLADSTLEIRLQQNWSLKSLFTNDPYSIYLALVNGRIGCATVCHLTLTRAVFI